MSINYNNINELLDLIYKFVYNPDNDTIDNYIFKKFIPSEIKKNDLIKTDDFEYQYILNSENRGNIETTIGKDLIKITNTYNFQNPTFEIKINEEVKDIMPQIKAFCNKYKSASKDVLVDDLSFTVDFKNYQIKILFSSINWYTKGNNYNFEETIYLVKSK